MNSLLSNRHTKIIMNIVMTVFLILCLLKWDGTGGAIRHILVGIACALIFAVHLYIHRIWIETVAKSFMARKFNKALKGKLIIETLLFIVFSLSIVTGFFAIVPYFNDMGGTGIGRLHGVASRAVVVLSIIHVVQHLQQIKVYLGIGKRKKNEN
ncbi:MAG: hypothetical protein FWE54_02080 [Methanimicrococcus sp.]|nr:hypothetical protein [Methanimicrococcus sp.]